METLKQILSWIRTLPTVGKIISLIAISLALLVMVFFSTSCGLTRATVRNNATGTTTTIRITTNNPTDVSTTPDVDLSLTDKNDK